MIKLDIIIPVYNEDKRIVQLLRALEDEIICNFRVLICYDNDSDKTLKYVKNTNIINKEILLVKNPKQGPNSAIIIFFGFPKFSQKVTNHIASISLNNFDIEGEVIKSPSFPNGLFLM